MRQPLTIGNKTINEGDRTAIDLQIPDLYTHNAMTLPVYVIHARQPGPVLFLSGAIHGDEINSVEIIRRVLKLKVLNQLRGTLIAVVCISSVMP